MKWKICKLDGMYNEVYMLQIYGDMYCMVGKTEQGAWFSALCVQFKDWDGARTTTVINKETYEEHHTKNWAFECVGMHVHKMMKEFKKAVEEVQDVGGAWYMLPTESEEEKAAAG